MAHASRAFTARQCGKAREPGGRALEMSSCGGEENRKRAMQADFDHHFLKPVDPDALQKFIENKEGRLSS